MKVLGFTIHKFIPFALLITLSGAAFGLLLAPTVAYAQQAPVAAVSATDAPPPEAPATVRRDDQGRVSIRAVRVDRIKVDGMLDEEVYQTTPPIDGFIQQEPREGEPATEKTEAWVFFDDENIYVVRALLRQPPGADGGQRDAARQQQHLSERELHGRVRHVSRPAERLLLPGQRARRPARRPHHRRRATTTTTGTRSTTPGSARRPGVHGRDGHPVQVAALQRRPRTRSGASTCAASSSGRTSRPWSSRACRPRTARAAIYQCLRRPPRWCGLEVPATSRNLELKPYAISDVQDRPDRQARRLERSGRQRGVRRQVRPDAQPDRRLHLQHRLRAGRRRRAAGQPHAVQPVLSGEARVLPRGPGHLRLRRRGGRGGGLTPILFFSRRIGLASGQPVPIRAGGRVTGRAGKYTLGAAQHRDRPIRSACRPSPRTSPSCACAATSCGAARLGSSARTDR